MNVNEVEAVFKEFENTRTDIEVTIEELKQELLPYENRIVLYGAGSAGIAFYHYLNDAGIQVSCFADGDAEKNGTKCEGLEVWLPQIVAQKLGKDVLIIVTINTDGKHYCRDFKKSLLEGGHEGVHEKLKNWGFLNILDYTYFQRVFQLYKGGNYNLPACADVDLMYRSRSDILKVYDHLEDDLSKKIFVKVLTYRMLLKDTNIPTISENKQYFEWDLFPKKENEVFVDCGACAGSSLKIFLEESGGVFSKYYGIEPDCKNFERLSEYIDGLNPIYKDKIKLVNKAAFDQEDGIAFFALGGPGAFASTNGPDHVLSIQIDSLLSGTQATYIKMNIEGSEIPALRGAKKTIQQFKPRLAIMGYHKTSDLWEVPLLIYQFRKDYKLKLRSYMGNVALCYYAY